MRVARRIILSYKYSYTIEIKNTLPIPAWYPIKNYGVPVEQSSYEILTEGENVFRKAYHFSHVPNQSIDKDLFQINQMKAMTKERYAPPFLQIIPHVIFSHHHFQYEGYTGAYAIPKRNRFGTLLLDLLVALSVKNTREYPHSLRFSP